MAVAQSPTLVADDMNRQIYNKTSVKGRLAMNSINEGHQEEADKQDPFSTDAKKDEDVDGEDDCNDSSMPNKMVYVSENKSMKQV